MRYDRPTLSLEGDSNILIQSFGGIYKNPSITDQQAGCTVNGLCPAEADE